MRTTLGLIALLVCSAAADLSAQEPRPPMPPQRITKKVPIQKDIAVTTDLLLWLTPAFKVTGEVKLAPLLSVAAFVGAGKDGGPLYLGGAQVRGYLFGEFEEGMMYGAEAIVIRRNSDDRSPKDAGSGVGVGPFFGYKTTLESGFTFDWQLGFEHYITQVEGEGFGNTTVLLNINVGWSF